MALTPEDVRDVRFPTVRGRNRGYDMAAVDAFLEIVEQEIARLRAQLDDLRGEPPAENVTAVRMLEMAQRTAEDHLTAAHHEAERIILAARDEAGRLADQAAAERASLERAVADLKAFEQEYRSRLRAFVTAQVDDLDSRGRE